MTNSQEPTEPTGEPWVATGCRSCGLDTSGRTEAPSVILRPSPLDRKDRKQKARAMNDVVKRTPSLLRGVLPEAILHGFGATIRAGAKADEHGYTSSKPEPELAAFLSHSWHAPSSIKVAALFAYYNGDAGVCVGLVLALLVSRIDSMGYLPSFEIDNRFLNLYLPGGPDRINARFWSTAAYGFGYCLGLVFWQSVRRQIPRRGKRTPRAVFLDKVCIHQTDDQRKQQGIAAIGAFLLNSRQMLILWDKTYFYRLWCVFEVAVYLSLKPNGQVAIIPITLYCAEVVLSFAICATMLAYLLGECTGVVPFVIAYITQFLNSQLATLAWTMMAATVMLLFVMVLALRVFQRARLDMLIQLDTFSFDNARCFAESDREMVARTINDLYGSPLAFDTFARNEVRTVVEGNFGPSVGLTYRFLLKVLMSFAVGAMLDIVNSLEKTATPAYRRQWVVGFAAINFLHFPAFAKFVELASRLELHTTTTVAEFAVSAFIAAGCSGIGAVVVCSWSYSLGRSFLTNAASLVLGLLAVLLAWRYEIKARFDKVRQGTGRSLDWAESFWSSSDGIGISEACAPVENPQPSAPVEMRPSPDEALFLPVASAPSGEVPENGTGDSKVVPANIDLAPTPEWHAKSFDTGPVAAERCQGDTDWTTCPEVIGRRAPESRRTNSQHVLCCYLPRPEI